MAKRTTRSRIPRKSQSEAGTTLVAPTETAADEPQNLGAPGTESTSMGSEPSEEDIRTRAYQRYLQRGGGHGQDFDDWLEAERELRKRQ